MKSLDAWWCMRYKIVTTLYVGVAIVVCETFSKLHGFADRHQREQQR
jgi:hypothetical protein